MVSHNTLKVCPVTFVERGHTYYNDKNVALKSVTTLIREHIFKDKYALPKQRELEKTKAMVESGLSIVDTFQNPKDSAEELVSISDVYLNNLFRKYFATDEEYNAFLVQLEGAQSEYRFMQIRLEGASERGTAIHNAIEIADKQKRINDEKRANGEEILFTDELKETPTDEMAKAYRALIKKAKLFPIENEYLVSDLENLAGSIDVVLSNDSDEIILGDFKCTSHLDKDYLSWQLSIYKYLFELLNPTLKVTRLVSFWLPKPQYGKPRMDDIPMISTEEIEALIEVDKMGGKYSVRTVSKDTMLAERASDVVAIFRELKRYEEKKKELEATLLAFMEANDIKKFENDEITITRTLPTTQSKFDSKTFKNENPDLYEKYLMESNVKGSIRIKLK